MAIHIRCNSTPANEIKAEFPNATFIDIGKNGSEPWIQFRPTYPHGNIPVPFSKGHTSVTVEGIWQGLKVFDNYDIDMSLFNRRDTSLARPEASSAGKYMGHRKGVNGEYLIRLPQARIQIFLPAYRWILENRVNELVAQVRRMAGDVVIVDDNACDNIYTLDHAVSSGGLVRRWISGEWPGRLPVSPYELRLTKNDVYTESPVRITDCFIEPGDRVQEWQPLFIAESDKACIELSCPYSGIVVEVLTEVGNQVALGEVLCKLVEAE